MNGLDLFPQVVFLLLLVHLAPHFHVERRFQIGNFYFRVEEDHDAAQTGLDFGHFQDLLAHDEAQRQLGHDKVGHGAGFFNSLGLFPDFFTVADVFQPVGKLLQYDAAQRFFFYRIVFNFVDLDSGYFQIILLFRKALELHAVNPVDKDAHQPARKAEKLLNPDQGTALVHVVKARVVYFFIYLSRNDEQPVMFHGVIDGGQGFFPANVDVAEQFRIYDNAPQGNEGHR